MKTPPEKVKFAPWRLSSTEEDFEEYSASFPSPVTTPYEENNTVYLRAFLPTNRRAPVPVVLVLHYWGASDLRAERALAGDLCRRGCAAVVMALPYHLSRTPKGYRSGELAIQGDVGKLQQGMLQSVLDVRRTVDWIESHPEFDSGHLGVCGTSLGSLVSILAYGVESRFQRAAFVLGGVDLAGILWHSSRVVPQRDVLRRQGFTEAKLRQALSEIEPANYLLDRAKSKPFIVAGKFDTVIPRANTNGLIAGMPEAKTLWLETGHYGGIFVQRRVQSLVATYFSKEFAGEDFVPPKSVYAPTVRIAVDYPLGTGLQVGVGVDIWRAGGSFSTILATPRGAQLFLGTRISQGLSIGLVFAPRRIAPGLFWSTVL